MRSANATDFHLNSRIDGRQCKGCASWSEMAEFSELKEVLAQSSLLYRSACSHSRRKRSILRGQTNVASPFSAAPAFGQKCSAGAKLASKKRMGQQKYWEQNL
jgi:hypothetical protein